MARWLLTLEYDGTAFFGWQVQAIEPTVQSVLEKALCQLLNLSQIRVHVAGRTDTGVHALAQKAHVDIESAHDWQPYELRKGLNALMRPHPVSVVLAERVADDFHARFDACQRQYIYRLCNRPAAPTFDRHLVWHMPHQLNVDAMQQAAQCLVGVHDFSAFRAVGCQAKTPVKEMHYATVRREGDEIVFEFGASAFIYHQVRNMVGTLVKVGEGELSVADFKAVLEGCDRTKAGMNVPPHGLYFAGVVYDVDKIRRG